MTYEPPAWSPPGPAPESPAGGEPPTAIPAQPAYPVQAYPPPYDPNGYAAGYGTSGYGTAGYGTSGYGTAGYGASGYGTAAGYAFPVAKRTNSMAIASMTTSIVGLPLLLCYGLGLPVSVVGAILGHIAKRQIKERDEQGEGMALAGIIMGWIGTGLAVLGVGALIILITAVARTN